MDRCRVAAGRCGGTCHPLPVPERAPQVAFDRTELRVIFNLYGRRVAEGEWKDYALDFRRDKAVFSIYRRTSEMPLYRIEKDPKLARRQGAYAVIAASGLVMKRGTDLARCWWCWRRTAGGLSPAQASPIARTVARACVRTGSGRGRIGRGGTAWARPDPRRARRRSAGSNGP